MISICRAVSMFLLSFLAAGRSDSGLSRAGQQALASGLTGRWEGVVGALLVGALLIVTGLTYLPALTLGPVAEHLLQFSR